MSDFSIRADSLSKQYAIGRDRGYKALRDVITDAAVAPFRRVRSGLNRNGGGNHSGTQDSIWALKDISFEIGRGEVIGVIGRNGAGKSTLLKILSRITKPTRGHAIINGRVGSLLEVGTGFHPELTGRENIYLNGAILGMRKAEIVRKFDEIVAFAEVEKFVDTPVKRYSSGMYVRLAFGVAAHMETEVLLVDEVLAVGDAQFQKKCLGKMGEVANQGRTVLLVSHNMAAISRLCPRSILIDAGALKGFGPSPEMVGLYLSASQAESSFDLADRTDRSGNGSLRFSDVSIEGKAAGRRGVISGEECTFVIGYELDKTNPPRSVAIDLHLCDSIGKKLITFSSRFTGAAFLDLPNAGTLRCIVPRLPVSGGNYTVDLWAGGATGETLDLVARAGSLEVLDGDYYGFGRLPVQPKHGPFLCDHSWSFAD